YQCVRQIADESNRIGEQHLAFRGQSQGTKCGIERREHARGFQYTGVGERVKQSGFTGIGVSHECNGFHRHRFPPLTLLGADAANAVELSLDVTHAAIDFSTVSFELGLTRSAGADSAAELRHLRAASGKSR